MKLKKMSVGPYLNDKSRDVDNTQSFLLRQFTFYKLISCGSRPVEPFVIFGQSKVLFGRGLFVQSTAIPIIHPPLCPVKFLNDRLPHGFNLVLHTGRHLFAGTVSYENAVAVKRFLPRLPNKISAAALAQKDPGLHDNEMQKEEAVICGDRAEVVSRGKFITQD